MKTGPRGNEGSDLSRLAVFALLTKVNKMIRFLIVFIVAASVGWVGGHYGDRIYKRLVSLRYGHSEFSGLSIARANKLDHHKSIPARSGIVLVYGDSMIEFADLAELTGDARFINRGIRGDSIAGLTERTLTRLMRQPLPSL